MATDRTIAVYGGSFSPVHAGHMEVARGVLNRGLADEVWLMPCRLNPLKDGGGLMPDAERLKMLRLAADYSGLGDVLKVSSLELGMPSPSFTIDTMEALGHLEPDARLRLVVGADSYLDFKAWKDWETLERLYAPIVYPRPGYKITDLRSGWTLLEGVREIDISSTSLRRMMREGEDTSEFMPWLAG